MSVDDFHAVLATRGVPRDGYTTIEGYFAESLPPLGPDGPPRDIALAYVRRLRSVLQHGERVGVPRAPAQKHGMILAFDDYYCWTRSDVSGERAALGEFAGDQPESNVHRYMSIDWGGLAFVVEDATRCSGRSAMRAARTRERRFARSGSSPTGGSGRG
jgi:O-methyltransferase